MEIINRRNPILFTSFCLILTSCANEIKPPQKSLETVAKDWSMTVRASQVMPLYPLEEDVRPGDIYLVDKSLNSEVKAWNQKGFLPLNNRFDRMQIPQEVFDDFYSHGLAKDNPVSFSRPPTAAFPSYTFEVDKRGALGLAVPLSSVPVAISASGAQRATGSVVFTGASTQGLPDLVMQKQIDQWQLKRKAQLSKRAQYVGRPLILRLITRTFSIQGATVSLVFSSTKGASLQAGSTSAPSPDISTGTPDNQDNLSEEYESLIDEMNEKIALEKSSEDDDSSQEDTEGDNGDSDIVSLKAELATLKRLKNREDLKSRKRKVDRQASEDRFGGYLRPGGSIKVVGRTERGVTMSEEFDEPLVLGYWATEYFVTEQGSLIPLGSVMDLIDNPAEYQRLLKLAKEIQAMPGEEGAIDSGLIDDNPFVF